MRVFVKSNNGRIHFAESKTHTTVNEPQEHPGFVCKLCDGQWVSEERYRVEATEPTCKTCIKKGGS